MDRKDFIELCRECAILEKGVCGIPYQVPQNLIVKCQGIPYYPVGYYLDYDDDGVPRHTAYLHDLDANSITKCKLNDVEGYNGDNSFSKNA